MQCDSAQQLFDDLLDQQPIPQQSQLQQHLDGCRSCQQELAARQQLLAQLRSLPVPPPSSGFAARALRQARHQPRPRAVFAAGFGSAIAATLAVWLISNTWLADRPVVPPVHQVALQIEQPRTITLAFNSPDTLEKVTFQLQLPKGVALAGRPDTRQLQWQDSLKRGRNVLQLKLIGKYRTKGTLVATIEHDGGQKVFRVPLSVGTNDARSSLVRQHIAAPV